MITEQNNRDRDCELEKPQISRTRKRYILKLVFRCFALSFCVWLFFARPEEFVIISKGGFFDRFSLLHVLFGIWIIDMLFQLLPVRNIVPLGSQKHLKIRFMEIKEKINYKALKDYVTSTTKAAYKVLILWSILLTVIGVLYFARVINNSWLFMISVVFYVCDLICVLIWCPFRLMIGSRCCTTCRIYNWDHMMMFTPMMFIGSLYSTVLVLLAFIIFVVWESCFMLYPERFWDKSNEALKCSNCTDKLCTQYCRKLR
ncbi:MAG: hypothetical protein IJY69_03815 [Clostridia bacterium]|nr:hypothetical protein [Clostridia bacterium]